jgi:hypothetical protein
MSTRRKTQLLLVGLALIAISLACGLGAAPEAAAPEPAASEMTAPADALEEEPIKEAPAATEAPMEEPAEDMPPLLPPTIASSSPPPLPTPTGIVLVPLSLSEGITSPQPAPAIPESRRLTLEFPPVMRTGDSTRIRLQLEVDDRGNVIPTAVVEGNVVTGEVVEIPNLYETHNVIAEARLDMAGMGVQPPGTISEPLTPGKSVTFYWSVRPEESGKYEGTAWLHLRFIPMTTLNGEQESRIPVSVQFLEIEAKSLLGFLNGGAARGIGALGSLVGSVLGIPFVDDFVKWLWGKIRRK